MHYILIIDLQRGLRDKENKYGQTVRFIDTNIGKYDRSIAINKKSSGKKSKYKLDDQMDFETQGVKILEKTEVNIEWLMSTLDKEKDTVDIVGCDTEANVMDILFKLQKAGFEKVNILKDYVYTTAEGKSNKIMLDLMKRNFGTWLKNRVSI